MTADAAPAGSPGHEARPTLREARVEDAEAVAEIHVTSWRAAYEGIVENHVLEAMDVTSHLQFWHAELVAETGDGPQGERTLVAELDGEVVGFAAVGAPNLASSADVLSDDVGELKAIYLRPGTEGRGIGRALLDAARAWLREHGYREVHVWVLEGNERARAVYEAAGWPLHPDAEPVPMPRLGEGVRKVLHAGPA